MHLEGRSASTSGEQVSLNASDVGDPGEVLVGGAISSLNGPVPVPMVVLDLAWKPVKQV